MREIRLKAVGFLVLGLFAAAFPVYAAPACGGSAQADASSCLQEMINAGGMVTLQAGHTYRISRPLRLGPNTGLDGQGATLLSALPIRIFIQVRGTGTSIRNLKIRSSAAFDRSRVAIMVAPGTTGLRLEYNQISGYFGTVVMISGGRQSNVKISNNRIAPEGGKIGYGILVTAVNLGITAEAYPRDIEIISNTVTDVSADAIEVNSPVGQRAGYPATANSILIKNNTLSAPNSRNRVGFCVGIAGAYGVEISGNMMSDCKWQGIHVEDKASKIKISNNTIRRVIGPKTGETAWGKNSSGILVLNSSDVGIFGNTIVGAKHNGIDIGYNPKGMNRNVIIAGNTITDSGKAGILFSGHPKGDALSTIGAVEGYPANIIRNSGGADIVSCVLLRGEQGRTARCDRR